MKKIFLPIALVFCFLSLKAEISLPNIIGSNMVIQQNTNVRLWGGASKNAFVEISVSWSSEKVKVKADKNGQFSAEIKTGKYTFSPQTITFKDLKDNTELMLTDILIGEVWLASGQSNMQMPLK